MLHWLGQGCMLTRIPTYAKSLRKRFQTTRIATNLKRMIDSHIAYMEEQAGKLEPYKCGRVSHSSSHPCANRATPVIARQSLALDVQIKERSHGHAHCPPPNTFNFTNAPASSANTSPVTSIRTIVSPAVFFASLKASRCLCPLSDFRMSPVGSL
jgi:putative SOS response-associated peptidase YedK